MQFLRQDYQFLLFEFEGRISRLQFWVGLSVMAAAYASLFMLISMMLPDLVSAALIVPMIVFAVTMPVALVIKRLHDSNRSGWWYPGFLILTAALDVCLFLLLKPQFAMIGSGVVTALLNLWLLVELGFRTGTRGPNQYGHRHVAEKSRGHAFV
ncbi:DUF805 domain-containing protein [Coralliovum pocilloporae]|uniref:DUF805 domain-containing protein n=1 Tax=Coralliovum pocilloporae TaxID=3066369 RepID=UPI0033079F21